MVTAFNFQNGAIEQALQVNGGPLFYTCVDSSGVKYCASNLVVKVMMQQLTINFQGYSIACFLFKGGDAKKVPLVEGRYQSRAYWTVDRAK